MLLYIVNLVFIFFNSQIRSILRFKRKLRKATSASKIIINKREAKDDAREARETKVEAKKTKANIEASAKANARATTTTTTTNKKQLLKLRERFACTYVNLVLEIALILLSYLLLFNNLRKCASNTLYNQKLIKFLNLLIFIKTDNFI